MEELTALLALSRIGKIDHARKKRLVEGHERVASLFEGREKAENAADNKAIRGFHAFKEIDDDLARLSEMGATVLTKRTARTRRTG